MSAQGVTITQIYSNPSPSVIAPQLYVVIVGQPYRVVTYAEGSVGFVGQGNLIAPIEGDVALPYLSGSDNTPENLYAKIVSGEDTWYSSDSDFAIAMSGSSIYINSLSNWLSSTYNSNSINLFKVYTAAATWTSKNAGRLNIVDNSAVKVGDYIFYATSASAPTEKSKAKVTAVLSDGTDIRLNTTANGLYTTENIIAYRNIAGAEILVRYKAPIDGLDGMLDVNSLDDLYDNFGPGYIYPDSKLGYGAMKAYIAAGVKIKAWATRGETAVNYTEAFDDIKKKKDMYYIVPLTFDATVHSNLGSLVGTYAQPTKKHEMRGYISRKVGILFNTQNIGGSATKTFTVPTAVATDLNTGDVVIINNGYGARLAGTKIGAVTGISGTSVTIDTTVNAYAPLTIVPASVDLEVADASAISKGFNNKRITLVGPGYFEDGGYIVEGYFAAAAYAGWRSGVQVHYSATFEPIVGFTGIPRAYYFDDVQYRSLSDTGWLIYKQDTPSQTPYVLRQMTTAYSTLETAEESLVISFDSLAKWLRDNLEPYLSRGIDNRISQNASDPVTKRYLKKINSIVKIAEFKYVNDSEIFASLKVKELKPNPAIKDRTDLVVEVGFYYPNNTIHVELVQI